MPWTAAARGALLHGVLMHGAHMSKQSHGTSGTGPCRRGTELHVVQPHDERRQLAQQLDPLARLQPDPDR